MRPKHLLVSLVLCFGLACVTERDAPVASTPELVVPVAPDRLVVGEEHRYRFDWQVESDAERSILGDVPLHGGLQARGELALRVHEADGDGVWIGIEIVRVDVARIDVLGSNVLEDPGVLAGHEVLVHVGSHGDTRRALFAADTPSVARHVLTGLLAQLDLRVPGPHETAWESIATAGNGLARMEYARAAGDPAVLDRRIVAYERIDAVAGARADAPWAIDGRATIRLDARGLPSRIDAVEVVALRGEEQPLDFHSRARFELERTGTMAIVTPRPRTDRAAMIELDLLAPPDDAEAERELARRFAEGLTTADMLLAVHAATLGVRPPDGFLSRARGRLRGWPEDTRELAPLYHAADDTLGRAFVLDLLTAAGTEVAQQLMVELLAASTEREPHELPTLVQHVSLVDAPTPELARALLDLHARALDRGEPELRRATLYPLGSLAGQLGAVEPLVAARMLDVLRSELAFAESTDARQAAIAGLGNAAMPEDLDRLLAHVSDPDSAVRAGAVSALRHFRDQRSTDALFTALADPSRHVAATALSTIDGYRSSPEVLERLAIATTAAWHHRDLVGPLTGVLAVRGRDDALARAALASLWPRARDVPERLRIQRVLGRASG